MSVRPVTVVVVDDSAFMRALLCKVLESDADIRVIGTAEDTATAKTVIARLEPDVVTLDIAMPGGDGLTLLADLMRSRRRRVVMVSALTNEGTRASVEAMRLGAADCVAKPATPAELEAMGDLLRGIVRGAGSRPVARTELAGGSLPADAFAGTSHVTVALGASTGGVEAIFAIARRLPAICPPILVVQHMPEGFTQRFARRLNEDCAPLVCEARHGEPLRPGTIYIAPGGARHMGVAHGEIRLWEAPREQGHRPSVDMMFQTVARLGRRTVGVILTGMGSDGARGLLAIRQAGGRTLGQDEASSVIYGMPRAAREIGAVEREASLKRMPEAIARSCLAAVQGTV